MKIYYTFSKKLKVWVVYYRRGPFFHNTFKIYNSSAKAYAFARAHFELYGEKAKVVKKYI